MADTEQEQKKAAALAYDYDADAKWKEYWSNVLIPDNVASNPDAVKKYFQLKYYKRNIDPDLQVEPLSIPNRKPPLSTSSSSAEQRRPVNTGPQSANGGTRSRAYPPRVPPTVPPTSASPRLDRQSMQFLVNAWVLIMTVLTLFPFMPRGLSDRAYRLAFVGSALSSGHSLYCQYGRPRTWNLQGLQIWLQSVAAGSDFLQILYCIVFVAAFIPIKYAVMPLACRSLEQVAPYLKRNFSSTPLYRNVLAKPCTFVESNIPALQLLSTKAEVGLGFLLVVMMITPQRNLIQAMVYWQLLKLKYHSPASCRHHREVWAMLGARTSPLIQRFAPFLQTPVGYAQRWFLNAA